MEICEKRCSVCKLYMAIQVVGIFADDTGEESNRPVSENSNTTKNNPSEITYKLLLETVWVDDILDPSEVQLLARKRGELGLSFERHLQLVRDIIGG